MPTKTKKKVSKKEVPAGPIERMQDSAVLSLRAPRRHTEIYRFADDLSIPHPRQPRILRYVSLSTGRSEYINGEIFGERAEVPNKISITVEW